MPKQTIKAAADNLVQNKPLPYVGHEFESVKYRHEDQVRLLQLMGQVDLQLFSGYLTIQLAFGSFLIQQNVGSIYIRIGLLMVEFTVALLCLVLMRNNYLRRKEVVATIKNCNEALGLTQAGTILPDRAINANTRFRPWFGWYTLGVVISFLGIVMILFRPDQVDKVVNTTIIESTSASAKKIDSTASTVAPRSKKTEEAPKAKPQSRR
ncbi:hypothetical protein GCM10028805_54700 [Spirosoma harenae]